MSLEAIKPSDLMQIDVLPVSRTGFNSNHPDWEAVGDIANRAFEYGSDNAGTWLADDCHASSHIFVARNPGQGTSTPPLVGFALVQLKEGTSKVTVTAVDPEHQRQGIGLQLWKRIEDEAKRAGANKILVEHATPALEKTYEGHGFRKSTLGRLIGSTVMAKRLP